MATNFPTSLDTFTNPNSGNTLDSPSHSVQHSDINDAVEAIEAKVGIGLSTAGSATTGYALVASTGGTTTWSSVGTTGLTSGTATNGQVLTADGSGGVSYTSLSTSGLTFISSTTIGSGVGTVSLPTGTFTSTYDSYKVIWDASTCTSAPSAAVRFRFRLAGTDNTTAGSYNHTGFIATESALSLNNDSSTHSFVSSFQSSTPERFAVTIELFGVALAKETKYVCSGVGMDGGTRRNIATLGFHNVQTAFDSMTFNLDSGTMTGGKIKVYGYKN
jgi:hypothetical protein